MGLPSCRDWALTDKDGIGITGSLPALGNWQIEQLLVLTEVHTPFWEAEVRSQHLLTPVMCFWIIALGMLSCVHGVCRSQFLGIAFPSHTSMPSPEEAVPQSLR